MSAKRCLVDLSVEERESLSTLLKAGEMKVRKIAGAHMLLLAVAEKTDAEIAAALQVSLSTVVKRASATCTISA